MKHFLIGLLIFLVWSVIGIAGYSYYINNYRPIEEVEIVEKGPSFDELLLTSSHDAFSIEDLRSISFRNNEDSVVLGNDSLKQKIFGILNSNQNKQLSLTAFYGLEENAELAEKRAAYFKKALVDFGVNEDRVSFMATQAKLPLDADGTVSGGFGIQLDDISAAQASEIESGIANKILYANFASNTFKPDNTLQAYALELKNYLKLLTS